MDTAAYLKRVTKQIALIKHEVSKVVVGQDYVVDSIIRAILCDGHILLEGVPGLAKTLMVRTISKVMGSDFRRIQFTPDLLPTDLIGITAYDKDRGFFVVKGPIFSNFILADEINRAPPKVQSALLECMQEKQATIGKESFKMPLPFFVLATQNPLESLGTYPLPEAQIDRFLFKIKVDYPTVENEQKILKKNITLKKFEDYPLKEIMNPNKIIQLQNYVKKVYLDDKIEKYIVSIVDATRHPDKYNLKTAKYVEYGASPRASISLFIASKAEAVMNGKTFVVPQFVKNVAFDVLRHRIIINYEGQSEGINSETVIKEILDKVPVP